MTRRLIHLLLSLIALAGGSPASAQERASAPAARPWDTLLVPGGFSALQHSAQIGGQLEEWRTIPLVIELSHAGMDGLRHTRNINEWASLLRKLHRQATEISPDRRVSLAVREQQRAKVDDLFETLGLQYRSDTHSVRVRPAATGERDSLSLLDKAMSREDLAARLTAGETVSVMPADSQAPLPLGMAFWEGRFDPIPPAHDLLFAILASREMSSLYYGLLALDDETLHAVQADRKLAIALIRYALVLPTVGDALRIHTGQVVPPGGFDASADWQALVGERLDRPAEFVEALLRKDQGRLAHFYRTLSTLPALTEHATSLAAERANRRSRNLRRLYNHFTASLQVWRADAMVQPPAFGPADVLSAIAVREDGTLTGPSSRAFWEKAFESSGWPATSEGEATGTETGERVDAADILELVCKAGCDRERLGVVTLIQREFADPSPAMMPHLLAVARCRMRYPALALEIERMRLADPSIYSELGFVAHNLEDLGDSTGAQALVQYQAAVTFLARLRAVGAPVALVREHAGRLTTIPLTNKGFEGGLVRWLGRLFEPADGESLDGAAARTLAGAQWQPPGQPFEWEGLEYRVDVAATEQARIRAALEKFTANTLNTAATLVRLSDEMSDRISRGELDTVIVGVEEAAHASRDVTTVSWTGVPHEFGSLRGLPGDIAKTLRRDRSPDARALERATQTLRLAADLTGADALAALVYALALQDLDSDLAMSRELPRRHHLYSQGSAGRRGDPWSLPTERFPDGGTRYIGGSLLALEVGVPQFAVRRLASGRPSLEPTMSPALANAMLRNAALAAPWTVRAEDLTAIHDAHVRGLEIQQKWSANGNGDRHLAEGDVRGPRAGWLRWSDEPGESPVSSDLTRLVKLGGLRPAPTTSWGAPNPLSICLCLTLPERSWSMDGSPRDPDAVAGTLLEPSLRVALELHRRKLPAALAPGVLMLLMSDLIDSAVLPHPTDPHAIVRAVGGIPPVKFDDYIAAIAARGPLVRVEGGPGARQ